MSTTPPLGPPPQKKKEHVHFVLSISTQEHGQIPTGQPPKGGCVFVPLRLCQKPSTEESCGGAGPALPAHYISPVVWGRPSQVKSPPVLPRSCL